MKYKNIIFDIGGVLAYPKNGNWFITTNFWNILDINLINKDKLKESLIKFLYLQTEDPKTEEEEYKMFYKYYYEVLKDLNYPNLNKEIVDKIAYDCVYNDEKFIFYDDVKEILEVLSKDYDLYVLSNGWPSSLRVLKNKGIDIYFKDIIISSMYSTKKENNLFDIFLDKYNDVNTKESIFIDDRRHILEKANKYGFDLLLMDRNNTYTESKYKIINNMKNIMEVLK